MKFSLKYFTFPPTNTFFFRDKISQSSCYSGLFRFKLIQQQIVLLFIICGGLTNSFGATVTVTNGSNTGTGSLRSAISSASSGDIIVFSGVTTVSLTSGELIINKNLTINGGSGVTITRSSGTFRIFNIGVDIVATFNNLTISNGSSDYGGAIQVQGGSASLTLNNCIVQNSTASQIGGGIYSSSGALTLTNCTLKNNSCTFGTAALFSPGNLTMTGCTFEGNTNSGTYAILFQTTGGKTFSMTNCTVSNNTTFAIGYYNPSATGTITNCTFTNNGMGLYIYSGTLIMKNSLFADHSSDVLGVGLSSSSSYNIFESADAGGLSNGVNNNLTGIGDAGTLALASNGGSTQTVGLAPCSRAINAGTSSGAPTTDQRGSSRVGAVDVGAFEYQSAPSTFSVSSTVINACNGNNGSVDLTLSGGTSPYTYNWSGTGSGTDPRTNLAAGTYTVTVTDNGGCVATHSSTVTNLSPTTSNAGPDQTGAATCGGTQVTLSANNPSIGSGIWSVFSGTGGSFSNVSSPTSTFSGTAGSTYTLRWTISNGVCTSTNDMVVTFNRNPTTADAGPDQTSATTCGATQVTLAANSPSIGTGMWSVFSGTGGSFSNASSQTSTFSGTAGSTYTLRWTISNSPCTASTDDVVITFNRNPTTANAGPDQTSATTCGASQVTLAANSPSIGMGMWSVVSGTGGSFSNASSQTSTFSGTAGSTYTLRWTISNSPCTASTDDVVVTFNRNPTMANAGPDQTSATTCGVSQVNLAANSPAIGMGMWSMVSGTGGSFSNASSQTSTFSGTAGSTYTLRWTISNSPCTASTDDVVITFNRNPTTANAGPDQSGSTTCGLTQVTLAANTASVGTGSWSVVSGTGGSFGTA
ncbi:MAG: right-handed parallel beta-helix repeat-containing protein, partial [Saprospiraceae bacterium]|nr:right-handed parallel beta-helix repeat-containing protein [Saprospiraceae bacterium]